MPNWYIKIYTYYALILFALLLLLTLILYGLVKIMVPYRNQLQWVYAINKAIMLVWFPLTAHRISVNNEQVVDPSKTYVVVMNHQNILDMFAVGRKLIVAGKPLVKRELFRVPILGWVIRMVALAVNREDKESRNASYQLMVDEIKQDISLLIFPEGSRNRTNAPLNQFKHGAFRLAIECDTVILPVVILNIRTNAGEKPIFVKPCRVILHYLEEIHPASFNGDINALKEYCHSVMELAIRQYDPCFKTD